MNSYSIIRSFSTTLIFVCLLFGDGIAPGKPTVYALEPNAWPGELGDHSEYVDEATAEGTGQWQLQERQFFKQLVDPGSNPGAELRVSAFKNRLQSHYWGVVWIHSHCSATGALGIEPYTNLNAAQLAYWTYIGQGYLPEHIEIWQASTGSYGICVTEAAVNAWFGQTSCLDSTLVYAKSCHTSILLDDWGARFALGYSGSYSGLAGCDVFWQRMNGEEGKDNRLSLNAAQNVHPQLMTNGSNMALAPCVWSHQFNTQETSGNILFQIKMNEDISADHILSVTNATLSSVEWANIPAEVSQLDFTITNVTSTTQTYTVEADSARAMTLVWDPPDDPWAQHLDGNQEPEDTDGQGPNQDDYIFEGHAQTGIAETNQGLEPALCTALNAVLPNPASNRISIVYRVARPCLSKITIFDCSGRMVKKCERNDEAGQHTWVWDCIDAMSREVTSGCYFARFEADNHVKTEKFILLK
jgi:hypothetical protein